MTKVSSLNGFPSPYGDFVFQHSYRPIDSEHRERAVSVPLRGFCFSTPSRVARYSRAIQQFPSPYGDFVFQLMFLKVEKRNKPCFRPLTGILFFNWGKVRRRGIEKPPVSVPLRGFCFSTRLSTSSDVLHRSGVSVPLRGFCFSTIGEVPLIKGTSGTGFRPLTGILFFNKMCCRMKRRKENVVSVPLRGFCFSTRTLQESSSWQTCVSVPLRGFCFSTHRQLH